jgi:hypothetical protein
MSAQAQVNLLIKPPIASPGVLWGLAIILITLFGHLGYAGYVLNKARVTEKRVELLTQEKANVQASLTARSASGPSAQELKKEIDALRGKSGDLLQKLETAPPGRKENFARELTLLSQADSQGVWLNQITLEGATGGIILAGKALSSEAVFAYANKLNRVFEPYDTNFKAIEITEQTAETPAATKAPQTKQTRSKTVSFKLQ